jgi:hypothetical protein
MTPSFPKLNLLSTFSFFLEKLKKCPKFTWKLKQTIVMVGLPRKPIKNEGCGEEGHQWGDAKITWEY